MFVGFYGRVVQERSGTYKNMLFVYVFIGGLCRNVAERIENTIICSFLLEGCAGT